MIYWFLLASAIVQYQRKIKFVIKLKSCQSSCLTLSAPTPQKGQTQSKNSSAVATF